MKGSTMKFIRKSGDAYMHITPVGHWKAICGFVTSETGYIYDPDQPNCVDCDNIARINNITPMHHDEYNAECSDLIDEMRLFAKDPARHAVQTAVRSDELANLGKSPETIRCRCNLVEVAAALVEDGVNFQFWPKSVSGNRYIELSHGTEIWEERK